MKRLSKDPELQEKVLKVLERHGHIRMHGSTQCDVNPGLARVYSGTGDNQPLTPDPD